MKSKEKSTYTVTPVSQLKGSPRVPGDKSVSHRSLLFGALADGTTRVTGLLKSGDVRSTWGCLEAMGVQIREEEDGTVVIRGVGMHGLKAPQSILDCGNSGTTIRLLMGILSGQPFEVQLTGDDSLRRRPMKRIAAPLRQMGARLDLTRDEVAPVKMKGSKVLRPLAYELPVASAQLKSALLLAGLYADGETTLTGMIKSRDHTERLLPHFGVPVQVSQTTITVRGGHKLKANSVKVPGDISSAAFWIAAATLVPGAQMQLNDVSLNPSRIGFIHALRRMGARIETQLLEERPEDIGTIRIASASLKATSVQEEEVPALIDEIPLLAVLATQAQGRTEVRGARELRVKESDRIEAVAQNLRAMGAQVETFEDGFAIVGPQKLKGARIDSMDDHRIAMAFSIAGLVAEGPTEIIGTECVDISFPGFYESLKDMTSG